MTAAAKHFDPILGIDVHIVQPPGPVPPVPVPHPHTGMVLDPADYAPYIGGTVKVGGLQRAQAGTSTLMIPKHIPIGGTFLKPPGNEGEIFMGSSTVAADGDAFTYLALPVLTCQDIGIPAPGRPKGSPPKSLVLPTTVVLAIPAAVNVGGSPTVSLMALGMKAGLTALGKGLGKLAKKSSKFGDLIAKGKKAWKKVADAIQENADKLMKKLGIPPGARNKVSRAICSVTGHPIDVATGKVFTEFVDVQLGGALPFCFERVWFSTSVYEGPLGHGWHHNWDMRLFVDEHVALVRIGDGRHIAFADVEIGESTFHAAERLTLGRDDAGYWLRDHGGLTHRFAALPRGRVGEQVLALVHDRDGNRISFFYDHFGGLVKIVDSGSRTIRLHTDKRGRILAIEGPHPTDAAQTCTLFRYRYDDAGDMVEAVDGAGNATRFAYADHLLVRETNRNRFSFHFEYDGKNADARCIRTWGDGGIFARKLAYDDLANVTVVEDGAGHTTTYFHDGALVHRMVDPKGGVTITEYDDDHRIVARVDPLGLRWACEYDERGNAITLHQPNGAVTKVEYGEWDLAERLTAPDGGVWQWSYDARGRIATRTDPLDRTTRYEYGARGLERVIDATGAVSSLEYDPQGNLAALHTPVRAPRQWGYDRLGRLIESVDLRGNRRLRGYDAVGRVTRVVEPDGNIRELTYDPEGNTVHARDRHRDVRFTYRGMNRLATRTYGGTTIAFEYDGEERIVAIVNEKGLRHRFERDALGDVVRKVDFDGLVTLVERDIAGRVVQTQTPGGNRTRHQYDQAGRLVALFHGDDECERYRWDVCERLLAAETGASKLRFEYDVVGRMTKEWSGDDWIVSRYDDHDRRIGLHSSRGASLTMHRDGAGDVERVEAEAGATAWDVGFVRDIAGVELERRIGGLAVQWQRDAIGLPCEQTIRGAEGHIGRRRYTWDVDGRLAAIRDDHRGDVAYSYDDHGRLRGVTHGDGHVEARNHDEVGNLFASLERFDREYGAAGQLLQSWGDDGSTRYEYDGDGNRSRRIDPDGAEWRYRWSASGLLQSVARPDGEVVSFEYDALRRRTAKHFAGATTRWLWDGNRPLHEWIERDDDEPAPDPAVTWLFEPGSFAPMARLTDASADAIVTDHNGTPLCMVDRDGAVRWRGTFDSRGRVQHEGDAKLCPWRMPGQYEDAETGLYYNRHRYYDPAAGAYVSRDPLGLRGGWCAYGYVNDPTTWCDPLGLNQSCDPNDVKGGRHRETSKPPNDGMDSHHMPAKKSYEHTQLDPDDGPAIKMSPPDHRKTASNGSQPGSAKHRADQKALIDQGKVDDAIQMDIDDIQKKFPNGEHDEAILQMIDKLDQDFYDKITTPK